MHAHEGEDEDEDDAFYVLEGELTFLLEGNEVPAGPGTFVLLPPGVRHTFANRGNVVARCLNIHAPAGFDLRLEATRSARRAGQRTAPTRRCRRPSRGGMRG